MFEKLRIHSIPVQVAILIGIVLALMGLDIMYPSTEMVPILLLALVIMNPRVRTFAIDFAPFLVLLISYDTLRNFADNLSASDIHITDMIRWERSLFGGALPGRVLQTTLTDKPYTLALDVLTNTLYLSHFLTPVITAIFLWRRRKTDYWAFAITLLLMSFAGFATFVAFPAAPPWWATHHGYLPGEAITLDPFIVDADVVSAGPNPVAAMPSLHTAYPTLIALVCVAVWGRKALPVLLLPLGVAFSTFYLGHHWVIDALAGAGYAVFFFGTVFLWLRQREASLDWLIRHRPALTPHILRKR